MTPRIAANTSFEALSNLIHRYLLIFPGEAQKTAICPKQEHPAFSGESWVQSAKHYLKYPHLPAKAYRGLDAGRSPGLPELRASSQFISPRRTGAIRNSDVLPSYIPPRSCLWQDGITVAGQLPICTEFPSIPEMYRDRTNIRYVKEQNS